MFGKRICTTCGSTKRPRTVTPGMLLIEILLWLTFLIPGIIYSIWRMTSRKRVCRACGSTAIVPLNSPVGRELRAKYGR